MWVWEERGMLGLWEGRGEGGVSWKKEGGGKDVHEPMSVSRERVGGGIWDVCQGGKTG